MITIHPHVTTLQLLDRLAIHKYPDDDIEIELYQDGVTNYHWLTKDDQRTLISFLTSTDQPAGS